MKSLPTPRHDPIVALLLLCTTAFACSLFSSMNPYRGEVAKLLPTKVGKFERTAEPKVLNKDRLIPEMTKGMLDGVMARYFLIGGPPLRNVGVSAYSFVSSDQAKEALQLLKQAYLKHDYQIKEEAGRKKGWSSVGERFVLTHGPGKDRFTNGETYAFWRNGSVFFYAESFSENQLEDVTDIEKNFPY